MDDMTVEWSNQSRAFLVIIHSCPSIHTTCISFIHRPTESRPLLSMSHHYYYHYHYRTTTAPTIAQTTCPSLRPVPLMPQVHTSFPHLFPLPSSQDPLQILLQGRHHTHLHQYYCTPLAGLILCVNVCLGATLVLPTMQLHLGQ